MLNVDVQEQSVAGMGRNKLGTSSVSCHQPSEEFSASVERLLGRSFNLHVPNCSVSQGNMTSTMLKGELRVPQEPPVFAGPKIQQDILAPRSTLMPGFEEHVTLAPAERFRSVKSTVRNLTS
jgi:hypothetical protein